MLTLEIQIDHLKRSAKLISIRWQRELFDTSYTVATDYATPDWLLPPIGYYPRLVTTFDLPVAVTDSYRDYRECYPAAEAHSFGPTVCAIAVVVICFWSHSGDRQSFL